ncbi:MAG TPA: MFS transporter [Pyrinomonadaceae bacterium]|nr:MFS transporter [Pyrinomonadaceae bacterium]
MLLTLFMSARQTHEFRRERGVSEMFRALRNPNFRLFWAGAFLSNTGTWMQAVAQGWLVLEKSNSPFWLGVDGFMATVPGLFLTLAGGVFADLFDRRKLLIYTQAVAGLSALTLGILVMTHVVQVWMILCLSFVTGCCMSLAGPSYMALVFDLVGHKDLANAIALNSTQFQLARAIGPVFAGVGIKLFGLAGCFIANGISFVFVVIAMLLVKFNQPKASDGTPARSVRQKGVFLGDLLAGFRYVAGRPRVSMLLIISAVTSLFGAPYIYMTPVFARDILHVGETGLALLQGMAGAGALFGALFLAYLGDFRRKGWFILLGVLAFAICLVGFSLSTNMRLSLFFLFALGFGIVCSVAVTNTLLQKLVTDEMRGRVMSMFMLSFIGAMPIGNLIAGAASHRFGVPHTLAAGGIIIALFVTTVTLRSPQLREL